MDIMRRFLSIVVFTFFLFHFSFFIVPRVHAVDFVVNYTVQYQVNEQGKTHVTQQVALINKQTNLYAKEYSISIDSTKIKNVTARDAKGSIQPEVKNKDGKTEIRLSFNDQVVGVGSVLNFTLQYEDENITRKNGSIWEITIPGIADDQELGDYTVNLTVPPSFGQAAYLVPPPKNSFTWVKEQLVKGGISAAFGTKQVFELELTYFIENPSPQSIITEIALPPSTAYQEVLLESIIPAPETIVTDEDGNWLARYKLQPDESMTIDASVLTQVYLQPRQVSYTLDETNIADYLTPTQYWNSDQDITELAEKLKTPRDIYDYVVKTLSYDYSRVNQNISRKGASVALKTPNNAVCMEFTDVFIAIARAAGIPARQAVGYAYTTNAKLRPLSLVSDVLHAWPEYYDATRKRWIPVDPTWGSTTGGVDYFNKLDFNHIVFAYNGIRDAYPYPAGYYRKEGKEGKDVEVHFRDGVLPKEMPQVAISFDMPGRVFGGLSTNGTAVVKNTARVPMEGATITLESDSFGLSEERLAKTIPPFGSASIPFSIKPPQYFSFSQGVITAKVNGISQNHYVTVSPAFHIALPIFIIGIWVILAIVLIFKRRKMKNDK